MTSLSPVSDRPKTEPCDNVPDRGWYSELIALFDADGYTSRGIEAAIGRLHETESQYNEHAVLTLTICPLRSPADAAVVDAFQRLIRPWWIAVGGDLLACFTSAPERPAIAWLSRFESAATQRRHAALLQACGCLARPEWRDHLAGESTEWRVAAPQHHPSHPHGETA